MQGLIPDARLGGGADSVCLPDYKLDLVDCVSNKPRHALARCGRRGMSGGCIEELGMGMHS